MKTSLQRILLLVTCGLSWLTPWATQAQTYPTQPIKLIVAFSPGTGSDILGRILAVRLGERLGVPVTVENRAVSGRCGGHTGSGEINR